MPAKLTTTINKIQTVPNPTNAEKFDSAFEDMDITLDNYIYMPISKFGYNSENA